MTGTVRPIPEDAAAWSRLAAGACLAGEMEAGGGHLAIFLDLDAVPPALAGRRLRLCLGETGLMAVPLRAGPAQFGPLRLSLADALRHAGSPPRLLAEGLPPLPPGRIEGAPMEAVALVDEARFLARAARRDGRQPTPLPLALEARAAYRALPGFVPRAAALAVLAQLVLERDLARLSADDHAEARWLREEARGVLAEGRALLAGTATPDTEALRWMVALGTACGLLCLCQDDMEEARACFGAAAAQTPLLHLAPRAALELVWACLMQGLLLGLEGEDEAAREVLERGVNAFEPSVTARDLMAEVAAMDELIAVGRASRQCFVALAKLGLLAVRPTPRYEEGMPLNLGHFAPAVPRLNAAGLCPRLSERLAQLGITRS